MSTTRTSRSPDAVVIGGGIVGCAVAWFLSRAGLRVTLLDRDAIAGGTSGCCMGHLMVTADHDMLHALTSRSVTLWNRMFDEIGSIERRMTGALYLAEDESDLSLLDRLQGDFARHGEASQRLDGQALRELEPALAEDLPGGLFYPRDGVVLPMQAAGRMAADARRLGAEVRPFTPVTGLRLGAGRRVEAVLTPDGAIPTTNVVNAAGVFAPALTELAGLGRAPIHPRRGDLAITNARTAPIRTQLIEVSYLRVAHGSTKVDPTGRVPDPGAQAMNVQPQSNGSCLIGSTRQFVGMDRRVDPALLRHSLRRAARYVPALAQAQITRTWAGLRPWTSDKLPIVGPVDAVPGFHMAAGHEGLGITLAPITGELVMQAMTGAKPSIALEPLALVRFSAEMTTKGGTNG